MRELLDFILFILFVYFLIRFWRRNQFKLVSILIGLLFLQLFFDTDNWLSLVLSLILILNPIYLMMIDQSAVKYCSYCKSSKIKHIGGTTDFTTFPRGFYFGTYICKDCEAQTEFDSALTFLPNRFSRICRRTLIKSAKDSKLSRTGEDWEDPEATMSD